MLKTESGSRIWKRLANTPRQVVCHLEDEAREFSKEMGFPLLIRSSFAPGGLGSGFANNEAQMIDIWMLPLTITVMS